MKVRKYTIERYVVEEGDYEECKYFENDDSFSYEGDTYGCEPIYEKQIKKETITINTNHL